ncbi:MAG: LamG domain-containing protein, partial [Kiritimatiellaeota bacterium]|nr:LamG domain-containing protein [Kiritimatiellota bacterium]
FYIAGPTRYDLVGSSSWQFAFEKEPFPEGQWTFLAGTYKPGQQAFYINGKLDAEKPHAGTIVANSQPLLIGKGLGHLKPSLAGRVGELRLYARCLPPDEITALYTQTSAALGLAAPAQKKFNDGTVIVETHNSSPGDSTPWRKNPTRLLEQL